MASGGLEEVVGILLTRLIGPLFSNRLQVTRLGPLKDVVGKWMGKTRSSNARSLHENYISRYD